jgi:hypothetical protein
MNQQSPLSAIKTNAPKFFELQDLRTILIVVAFQCWWTSFFISTKVGLINVLPTFIFVWILYWFIKSLVDIQYSRWFFLFGSIVTLRLPVTILPQLEPFNWMLYLSIIGLIFYKFFQYFQRRNSLLVLSATIIIVFFNSFSHLSLDSPFTQIFRLANQLSSSYVPGKSNDLTGECAYEDSILPVNCDMRHFIISEKIFTDPKAEAEAKFSVFLNRFFYGYLNSLVGVSGHRLFMSISLNIFLWISACIAIYRIGEITHLNYRICSIAMLCCASSWGFVHFVAQPSPHITAFAFAAIILWATLELIHDEFFNPALLIVIIISGSLVYDIYPLILISTILLFLYKRSVFGILIPSLSIGLSLIWKYISLQQILGTIGNVGNRSSPSSNLTYSFQHWIKAISNFDLGTIWQYLINGLITYFYGGMIFGTIASIGLIAYLSTRKKDINNSANYQLLFNSSICLCVVMLIAMFFVSPQSEIWSPTKLYPRLAFYTYPINTLAIAFFADKLTNKWRYIAPALTFVVANLTVIKLASISMFFEYGLVGWYWQ